MRRLSMPDRDMPNHGRGQADGLDPLAYQNVLFPGEIREI